MLSNATNQPKSTVELGYMCPRGLLGPPAVDEWMKQMNETNEWMSANTLKGCVSNMAFGHFL